MPGIQEKIKFERSRMDHVIGRVKLSSQGPKWQSRRWKTDFFLFGPTLWIFGNLCDERGGAVDLLFQSTSCGFPSFGSKVAERWFPGISKGSCLIAPTPPSPTPRGFIVIWRPRRERRETTRRPGPKGKGVKKSLISLSQRRLCVGVN